MVRVHLPSCWLVTGQRLLPYDYFLVVRFSRRGIGTPATFLRWRSTAYFTDILLWCNGLNAFGRLPNINHHNGYHHISGRYDDHLGRVPSDGSSSPRWTDSTCLRVDSCRSLSCSGCFQVLFVKFLRVIELIRRPCFTIQTFSHTCHRQRNLPLLLSMSLHRSIQESDESTISVSLKCERKARKCFGNLNTPLASLINMPHA